MPVSSDAKTTERYHEVTKHTRVHTLASQYTTFSCVTPSQKHNGEKWTENVAKIHKYFSGSLNQYSCATLKQKPTQRDSLPTTPTDAMYCAGSRAAFNRDKAAKLEERV